MRLHEVRETLEFGLSIYLVYQRSSTDFGRPKWLSSSSIVSATSETWKVRNSIEPYCDCPTLGRWAVEAMCKLKAKS